MNKIVGLTSDPKQQFSFVLDDRSRVFVYMEFRQQQLGWFADFTWGEWQLRGLRITASANLLRQYENQIPFGLLVAMSGSLDPIHLTDFADGSAEMVVLNEADRETVNELAFSGF